MPALSVHFSADALEAVKRVAEALRRDEGSRFYERSLSYICRALIEEGLEREEKSRKRGRSSPRKAGTPRP